MAHITVVPLVPEAVAVLGWLPDTAATGPTTQVAVGSDGAPGGRSRFIVVACLR